MDSNFQKIVKLNIDKIEIAIQKNENFMMLLPLAKLYKGALIKQVNVDETSIYKKLLELKTQIDSMIAVYETQPK
jgi:hypothetical protein